MHYSASLLFLFAGIVACEWDAGPAGPPGKDGAADIISGTFSVAPSAYVNGFRHLPVDCGTQANPAKVATISVPTITSGILANGVVLVYLRIPSTPVGSNDHWTMVPIRTDSAADILSASRQRKGGGNPDRVVARKHPSDNASYVYAATLPTYEFRWAPSKATSVQR